MTGAPLSRRDLLRGLAAGALAGAYAHARFFPGGPVTPPDHEGPQLPFVHPYDKLAKISPRKRQLWPVSYVGRKGGGPGLVDDALRDVEASLEGGADAVVF